jgi:hypothetical protein
MPKNHEKPVNVKQARGAGSVLLVTIFWAPLFVWWALILCLWVVWMPVAGITTIFKTGFFKRTWYYPWPAHMFGIR